VSFTALLFRVAGKGGWTFAVVPAKHAPSDRRAWGRTSVLATVDGHEWKTSVWREKSGRTVLPVPKAARGDKTGGDRVRVRLEYTL
jgi:hypothetical protein